MTNLEEINAYLDRKNVLNAFVRFAASNKVPANPKEIKISLDILKTQLYAYIARNMLDNEGFYPSIEKIDNTLQKAIAVLSDKQVEYASKKTSE